LPGATTICSFVDVKAFFVKAGASLTFAVAAAGCAHPAPPTSELAPPPARIGIYRFEERPSQVDEPLRGRIVVTHDSVWVDAEPGPCNYDPSSGRGSVITYRCADVTYSFDRNDPINKSRYSKLAIVVEHKKNCARYAVDSQGRQTCVQQQVDAVEHQVQVTGSLHLIAIAKPD
jgi:hypothetical protein